MSLPNPVTKPIPPRQVGWLSAVLWHWLLLGGLLLVLMPVETWQSALIGWLPYWLVAAPLLLMALRKLARQGAGPPGPRTVRPH